MRKNALSMVSKPPLIFDVAANICIHSSTLYTYTDISWYIKNEGRLVTFCLPGTLFTYGNYFM